MDGLTFILVVLLGIGVVGVLYVIYHVVSMANTVYELRIELRREMQGREERLRELLDSKTGQHDTRHEDALRALREELNAENLAYRKDVARAFERLNTELATLKKQHGVKVPPSESAPQRTQRQQGHA